MKRYLVRRAETNYLNWSYWTTTNYQSILRYRRFQNHSHDWLSAGTRARWGCEWRRGQRSCRSCFPRPCYWLWWYKSSSPCNIKYDNRDTKDDNCDKRNDTHWKPWNERWYTIIDTMITVVCKMITVVWKKMTGICKMITVVCNMMTVVCKMICHNM